MRKLILKILIIIGFLNSCNSPGNSKKKTILTQENSGLFLSEIDFIEIGKGILYGGGEEGILKTNKIISNFQDWETLLLKMNSVNNVSDYFSEIDIDFNEFSLIVIALDLKSSGWNVEIDSIFENENNIGITLLKTRYETTVITQPFHIVKIPKTNKEIIADIKSTEIIYVDVSIDNSETYEFNLGLETGAYIKTKPENFEINEIINKEFDKKYKYKPSQNYKGIDFVEIYINNTQTKDIFSEPRLIKIIFDVV